MMDFLQKMGGGQSGKEEYQDFVSRYEKGAPWDGIPDDEAVSRYEQVSAALPQNEYQDAAEQAFSRLSPDERMQFFEFLQQRAQQQSMRLPELEQAPQRERYQDPRALAQVTSQVQQKDPGLLGQLLKGAGGAGGNPLAKGALAGIAAMAAKKFLG